MRFLRRSISFRVWFEQSSSTMYTFSLSSKTWSKCTTFRCPKDLWILISLTN